MRNRLFVFFCFLLGALLLVSCPPPEPTPVTPEGGDTPVVVSYSVDFVSNGGTAVESQRVVEGKSATEPEEPQMEGYIFLGWCSDSTLNKFYDFNQPIYSKLTLYAKWLVKENPEAEFCYVIFDSNGGTPIEYQEVKKGELAQEPEKPQRLSFNFERWCSDSALTVAYNFTQPVTTNLKLYADWDGYQWTSSPITLPEGTDGTYGTNGTYILFGDWPQTIKDETVEIDKNKVHTTGSHTYYKGSDDYWYIEVVEAPYGYKTVYYSDGQATDRENPKTLYFKVEPIKWRVLTTNYDYDGEQGDQTASLLLADCILESGINFFYLSWYSTKYYANNYERSTLRSYLNGVNHGDNNSYDDQGFLQMAFLESARSVILETEVDNTFESTYDEEEKLKNQGTQTYVCDNTKDFIFPLSMREATSSAFGFSGVNANDKMKVRVVSDYSIARGAQVRSNGISGRWWLRSPRYVEGGHGASTYFVYTTGLINLLDPDDNKSVTFTHCGIVPALCIKLEDK